MTADQPSVPTTCSGRRVARPRRLQPAARRPRALSAPLAQPWVRSGQSGAVGRTAVSPHEPHPEGARQDAQVVTERVEARRCLVLGAGYSRAVSPLMPTTDELGDQAAQALADEGIQNS